MRYYNESDQTYKSDHSRCRSRDAHSAQDQFLSLALLALFHQLSSGHIVTPKSTKYRMAYPTGCTLCTRPMPYVNYSIKKVLTYDTLIFQIKQEL
jgi:hypothetical protein